MVCKCGCKREFEIERTRQGSGLNRLFYSKECGQRYRNRARKGKVKTSCMLAFGKPEPKPGSKNG